MKLEVINDNGLKTNFSFVREQFNLAYQESNKKIESGKNVAKHRPLLSKPDSNTKLSKKTDRTSGYKLYSLFLAPSDLSGYNVCPWSSNECVKVCLNGAGRGAFHSVQNARISKTKMLFERPKIFMETIISELFTAMKSAKKNDNKLALRMNGTQDISWEHIAKFISNFCEQGTENQFFADLPKFRLYDYTKSFVRVMNRPEWYDMTFSFNGQNWEQCKKILDSKMGRVALVFLDKVPNEYEGYEVINGDLDDFRFLDPLGSIVGLKYKSIGKEKDAEVANSCSHKPETFVIKI
jgi:hypothetical protein